jgi:hypothetical protein
MGLILGRFHMDHLPQVIDVALEGCRNIYTILDKVRMSTLNQCFIVVPVVPYLFGPVCSKTCILIS